MKYKIKEVLHQVNDGVNNQVGGHVWWQVWGQAREKVGVQAFWWKIRNQILDIRN